MSQGKVIREDLIYPELSYQIEGCAFEVFNTLGPGHSEKVYQKAFAEALRMKGITFKEQVCYSLKFNDKVMDKGFLDFEIDNKVIVELKKDETFSKIRIDQVLGYIRAI